MRRLVILGFVLAFAVAGCGGGDDEAASGGDTTTAVTECGDVEAPDARAAETREAPTEGLDPSTTYALTFDTSCGSFTVTLDPESVRLDGRVAMITGASSG